MPAPPPRAATELRARRRRITRGLLGGLTVLGGLAYIPSVWAAVLIGAWSIVVLDTVVYAAVIVAFLHPRLDDRVRGWTVVAAAAVLGVTLSVVFGPNGAGALWLGAVPILTALLFDRRATVGSIMFLVAALATVLALRWTGVVSWDITPGGTFLWLVIAGNVVVIAGAVALTVSTLIGGLTEAADRTERYGAALAREQVELLRSKDRLERAVLERTRAEAQLRQAEKLTAIGTLASGIAHDMNNLLVPIVTGTELLLAEEADERGTRAEILDRTLDAARAASDLVQRILAFTRPADQGRSPLDAISVFRDAARLLKASLPPHIELVFRAEPDTGSVVLSNAEAYQIVLNLGTNSAQAMPEGGRLTIALDTMPAGDEPPGTPTPRSGHFIRLMVTDPGTGMDEETMSRIFEPFFTSRGPTATPGHGIGLAAVYGIVSSAGGYIMPHSRPGAGTVMEVFLPRAEEHAHTPPVARPPRPAAARTGGNLSQAILVVDDDESARLMAATVLKRAGYRVETADSAEAALHRVRHGTPFDLVLTDLAMPGMDGLEMSARLRETEPGLSIILMSGLIDDDVRRRAAELDIPAVVAKPFGVDDLTTPVAAALNPAAATPT